MITVKGAKAYLEDQGLKFVETRVTRCARERFYVFTNPERPSKELRLFTSELRYIARRKLSMSVLDSYYFCVG